MEVVAQSPLTTTHLQPPVLLLALLPDAASRVMADDAARALDALKQAFSNAAGMTVGSAASPAVDASEARPSMYAHRVRGLPLVTKMMAQQYGTQTAAVQHSSDSCFTDDRGCQGSNAAGAAGPPHHTAPQDKRRSQHRSSSSSMWGKLDEPRATSEGEAIDQAPPPGESSHGCSGWHLVQSLKGGCCHQQHRSRWSPASLGVSISDDVHPLMIRGLQQLLDVSATAAGALSQTQHQVRGRSKLSGLAGPQTASGF